MSIPSRFPSAVAARQAGWFSRRHETDAAHRGEQERRRLEDEMRRDRELAQLEDERSWKTTRSATR